MIWIIKSVDLYNNRIGGVMVRVLASSVVDRWFESRLGQTKEYKIAIGLLLLPGTEPDSLIECN